MKIYIIGQVASGKSTLAKKLAHKYRLSYYELDKIIWDDIQGIKRNYQDIKNKIEEIKKQESWIIEDVGRSIFQELYPLCDIIYYLKIPTVFLYYRVIKRWIKQLLKLEKSNYPQNIKTLKQMLTWLKKGLQKENTKLNSIPQDKLKIITFFKIKKMLK